MGSPVARKGMILKHHSSASSRIEGSPTLQAQRSPERGRGALTWARLLDLVLLASWDIAIVACQIWAAPQWLGAVASHPDSHLSSFRRHPRPGASRPLAQT